MSVYAYKHVPVSLECVLLKNITEAKLLCYKQLLIP